MTERSTSILILAMLAAAMISSCGSAKGVTPGEPFQLTYGDEAETDGVTIRFAEIVAESRCPRSVTCVWAGDAEIRLLLMKGDERQSLRLHTAGTAEMPSSASAMGLRIELVELVPYPETPERIPSNSYRVRLKVTHAED
jgi:hypothetical protein